MNEFGFLLKTGIINNTCKQAGKKVIFACHSDEDQSLKWFAKNQYHH